MIQETKELFISYKHEPINDQLVKDLKRLIELRFPYIRVMLDVTEGKTGASIKAYMDRLAGGDYIIFLLSPAFLESYWCMYELAMTKDNPDFKDRVFHVRLPGLQIDTPGDVAKITMFWKQKWYDLNEYMKQIAAGDESHLAPEFQEELRISGEIVKGSASALLAMRYTIALEADKNGEIKWTKMMEFLESWVKPPTPQFPPSIQQLLADMCAIPAAAYTMGGAQTSAFKPQLAQIQAFQMGRHPVTQAQWQAIMGENPSHFQQADAPVECVSWADCQDFLARLNGLTGRAFRLPAEAEWEYAASASTPALEPASAIVHDQNAHWQSQPIGGRPANAFGLQDMLGNVFEWCADPDGEDLTGKADLRVIRGGAWLSHLDDCTAFARHNEYADTRHPAIGFRLAEGG